MAIAKEPDKTNKSVQEIENLSFDTDFNILAVELIGYDGTNTTRVAVTSTGAVKITI